MKNVSGTVVEEIKTHTFCVQ